MMRAMSAPRPLHGVLTLACVLALGGCNKEGESSNAPASAAKAEPADAVEAAVDDLLKRLAAGDYAKMKEITAGALSEDLSPAAYEDLSQIVAWLGWVEEKQQVQEDVPLEGGGTRRTYEIQFEKEEVVLETSVLPDGKVMGFHFSGDGFYRAEHGVIADQYQVFKVYDFHWTEPDGTKVAIETPRKSTTVSYHLVVGGIEAFAGQHHIKVSKSLKDDSGQELLVEPIEYDVQFSENAEGIPRGEMTGELDVPGPGRYELIMVLRDDIAVIETEYRVNFEVKP